MSTRSTKDTGGDTGATTKAVISTCCVGSCHLAESEAVKHASSRLSEQRLTESRFFLRSLGEVLAAVSSAAHVRPSPRHRQIRRYSVAAGRGKLTSGAGWFVGIFMKLSVDSRGSTWKHEDSETGNDAPMCRNSPRSTRTTRRLDDDGSWPIFRER